MHKWDSEDDDASADIHSSASRSPTQESIEFSSNHMNASTVNHISAFDGYGLNIDTENRYTGTFANKTVI